MRATPGRTPRSRGAAGCRRPPAAALANYATEAANLVLAAAADPAIGNATAGAAGRHQPPPPPCPAACSGNTPDDVDKDIAAAVDLQPTKVGHLDVRCQGHAVDA